jgi:hypothetical protein
MPSLEDSSMLSILKGIRAELRDHETPLLQRVDASRRRDRRFDDQDRRFGGLEHRLSDLGGNWS